MAWSEQLPAGKYRGVYRDHAGRKRVVGGGPFTHRAQATRAAAAAETASRRSSWRNHDAAQRPWGDWCAAWWESRTIEPGTRRRDESRRDKHLIPRWGHVPVAAIRRHDVKGWAASLLADGLSPATVERCVALLSGSLAAAVDAELIDRNPAARIRLPKGQMAAERFLTPTELETVLDELPTQFDRILAQTLAYTGLRWDELVGVHRARVDWDRGLLRVVDVYDEVDGTMKPYPKGRRIRVVPIPGWLLDDLATLPTVGDTCGVEHRAGDCPGPLLFTSAEGCVVRAKWSDRWRAAVVRSGIGHARVHDLRHTFASYLIQGGIPLAEIGRLMGHLSPATTARYAHLGEAPNGAVLAALDAVHGANRGGVTDLQPVALGSR